MCQKTNKTFGSDLEHLPGFEALHVADPEQNAGMINESNLKHFLVFKAQCGVDPRVLYGQPPCFKGSTWGRFMSPIRNTSLFIRLHAETIQKCNPDHLVAFKAPCGEDPQVQFGTPPYF